LILAQNLLDHVPVHIREAAVGAVVSEGQLLVIEAEEVQDGGVDIVTLGEALAVGRFEALIALEREGLVWKCSARVGSARAEPWGKWPLTISLRRRRCTAVARLFRGARGERGAWGEAMGSKCRQF